jgi:hypothetical protein
MLPQNAKNDPRLNAHAFGRNVIAGTMPNPAARQMERSFAAENSSVFGIGKTTANVIEKPAPLCFRRLAVPRTAVVCLLEG